MVQSCHRGGATTWATFYFYNMKKVDSLVGFILLALGLKGSNTHICACYSLTRWVQSVAKSGMARQWDAVKKKQMPCITCQLCFCSQKTLWFQNSTVVRYWGCTCTGFGTYPRFHSERSTGIGLQVQKALIMTCYISYIPPLQIDLKLDPGCIPSYVDGRNPALAGRWFILS